MSTKRRPLTIQLHPKNDADILTNVRQFQDGQRNSALKEVLRAGFNLPGRQPDHHANGTLTAEIELLRRAVQLNAVQIEELRQENEALRQTLQELPGYLADVLSKFASLVSIAPSEPPVEIEEAPRLGESELRQRASNMRKAQW